MENHLNYRVPHRKNSSYRGSGKWSTLLKWILFVSLFAILVIVLLVFAEYSKEKSSNKLRIKESYSQMYYNRNYLELIEKMDGELKVDMYQPEYLAYRGIAYYLLGEAEKDLSKRNIYLDHALYDLRKVLVLSSSQELLSNVYFCLGKIYYYYGTGYYNQTIEYMTKALKIGNERTDLLYVLGLVYSYIGDYEKANEVLLKSITMERSDLSLLALGVNHERMEKFSEAKQYLEEVVDRSIDKKNKEQALLVLGRINFEQKEYKRAFDYYNQIIDLNENSYEAYFQRGEIYNIYYGDRIKARADWRKTIEIVPSHISANNRLR